MPEITPSGARAGVPTAARPDPPPPGNDVAYLPGAQLALTVIVALELAGGREPILLPGRRGTAHEHQRAPKRSGGAQRMSTSQHRSGAEAHSA